MKPPFLMFEKYFNQECLDIIKSERGKLLTNHDSRFLSEALASWTAKGSEGYIGLDDMLFAGITKYQGLRKRLDMLSSKGVIKKEKVKIDSVNRPVNAYVVPIPKGAILSLDHKSIEESPFYENQVMASSDEDIVEVMFTSIFESIPIRQTRNKLEKMIDFKGDEYPVRISMDETDGFYICKYQDLMIWIKIIQKFEGFYIMSKSDPKIEFKNRMEFELSKFFVYMGWGSSSGGYLKMIYGALNRMWCTSVNLENFPERILRKYDQNSLASRFNMLIDPVIDSQNEISNNVIGKTKISLSIPYFIFDYIKQGGLVEKYIPKSIASIRTPIAFYFMMRVHSASIKGKNIFKRIISLDSFFEYISLDLGSYSTAKEDFKNSMLIVHEDLVKMDISHTLKTVSSPENFKLSSLSGNYEVITSKGEGGQKCELISMYIHPYQVSINGNNIYIKKRDSAPSLNVSLNTPVQGNLNI